MDTRQRVNHRREQVMHAASERLQGLARGHEARLLANSIGEAKGAEIESAAMILQAATRGRDTRVQAEICNGMYSGLEDVLYEASRVLQAAVRGRVIRKSVTEVAAEEISCHGSKKQDETECAEAWASDALPSPEALERAAIGMLHEKLDRMIDTSNKPVLQQQSDDHDTGALPGNIGQIFDQYATEMVVLGHSYQQCRL